MTHEESGNSNIVGGRLRQIRRERGLKQTDVLLLLSQHGLSLTAPALSKIECRHRGVSDIELLAFSKALDIELSDLFPAS